MIPNNKHLNDSLTGLHPCDIGNVCNSHISSNNKQDVQLTIDNKVQMAKDYCKSMEIRFTRLREDVYRIVLESSHPLGAYDIINIMQQNQLVTDASLKKIAPPTIYRSLQFLLDNGFIHQIVSLNAFIPCCHPRSAHVAGFLICDSCNRVQECSDEVLISLINHTNDKIGFKISSSVIELTGLCEQCQE